MYDPIFFSRENLKADFNLTTLNYDIGRGFQGVPYNFSPDFFFLSFFFKHLEIMHIARESGGLNFGNSNAKKVWI